MILGRGSAVCSPTLARRSLLRQLGDHGGARPAGVTRRANGSWCSQPIGSGRRRPARRRPHRSAPRPAPGRRAAAVALALLAKLPLAVAAPSAEHRCGASDPGGTGGGHREIASRGAATRQSPSRASSAAERRPPRASARRERECGGAGGYREIERERGWHG